jgi:hypothetical protein
MAALAGWTRAVTRVEAIPEALRDAFRALRAGRPRGAYLQIPLDLLEAAAELAIPAPSLPCAGRMLCPRRKRPRMLGRHAQAARLILSYGAQVLLCPLREPSPCAEMGAQLVREGGGLGVQGVQAGDPVAGEPGIDEEVGRDRALRRRGDGGQERSCAAVPDEHEGARRQQGRQGPCHGGRVLLPEGRRCRGIIRQRRQERHQAPAAERRGDGRPGQRAHEWAVHQHDGRLLDHAGSPLPG